MATTPNIRFADRQRSAAELEILGLLAAEPATHVRRGQIHRLMKAERRPTPARVGQLLSALAAEGLLETVHAAARGNRETAFYSLTAEGRELVARLGLAPALPQWAPPNEVAEAAAARYDAGYGPALSMLDLSRSGLVEEVIEVEIDASGNVVPPRNAGLRPGRALLSVLRSDAFGRVPEKAAAPAVQSLFGLLKARRGVPLEEMDRVLRERALARFHDRG
jgi:DNA-binding PadR family transcriptional regulator